MKNTHYLCLVARLVDEKQFRTVRLTIKSVFNRQQTLIRDRTRPVRDRMRPPTRIWSGLYSRSGVRIQIRNE